MAELGKKQVNMSDSEMAMEICGCRKNIADCEDKYDYAFYVQIFNNFDLEAAVVGYQNSPLFNVTETPEGFWRIASNGWNSGGTFHMALNYFNSNLDRTNGEGRRKYYVLNMLTPKQYEHEANREIALKPRAYEY